MNTRILIRFLGCIFVIILSEYFLLTELYNGRRAVVLLSAVAGLLASILAFWRSYRKFRKSATPAA